MIQDVLERRERLRARRMLCVEQLDRHCHRSWFEPGDRAIATLLESMIALIDEVMPDERIGRWCTTPLLRDAGYRRLQVSAVDVDGYRLILRDPAWPPTLPPIRAAAIDVEWLAPPVTP